MGDLVVTKDELPKVTDALQAAGIEQTALHKHLLQQSPAIWWTHIHAMGDPAKLARGVKAALAVTGIPPATPPPSTQPPIDLDTHAIDATLGRTGTAGGGIYKYHRGPPGHRHRRPPRPGRRAGHHHRQRLRRPLAGPRNLLNQ